MSQQQSKKPDYEIEGMRSHLEWAFTLNDEYLPKEDKEAIIKFVLVFNIFENWLSKQDKNEHIRDIRDQLCDDLHAADWFNVGEYEEYDQFFFERLRENNRFQRMEFRSDNDRKLVEKFVNGQRDDDLFKIYLILAYHYRHKFFHGAKYWATIKQDYVGCFKVIVRMMHKLLSDMLEHKFIGLDYKTNRKDLN